MSLVALFVSHRFMNVANADWIIVLSPDGKFEAGTHDHLLSIGGTYASLYASQARGYAESDTEPTGRMVGDGE